jgi:outer membrane receptor protein involved in Fe transport
MGALLAATAVAPLLMAQPVMAQTTPATTSAASSANVTEVIVTANRREQALSKVTSSVSAFSSAKMDIQGIKSFSDISKFTPGVVFDEASHDITIRGIESTAGSSTTGVYIDDTPVQARNLGFNSNNTLPTVFDLNRVEVLRGPQGTLFGAGSEGGTVRYITNQPSLTSFSGFAHAEVSGTIDGAPSYEVGFAEGGPLVEDKLGFRISAWYRRDGGYIDRVDYQTLDPTMTNANAVDTIALRAAFTWKPTPSLEITPAIDFQHRDQHNYDDYWVAISDPGAGKFLNGTPDRMPDRDKFLLPTLKIEWYGPGVNFISNTSYYARKEKVGGYSGTLYDLSYFQHFLYGDIWGVPNPSPAPGGSPYLGTDPVGNVCPNNTCQGLYPLLLPNGPNTADGPQIANYYASNQITNSQYDWTQEFRLQSANSQARLQWTAGVFMAFNYQRSTEEIRDPELPALTAFLWPFDAGPNPTGGCPANTDGMGNIIPVPNDPMYNAWCEELLPNGDDYIKDTRSHDRQIALYADATYNITPQLKAEIGLRFAWTHFDFVSLDDGPQDLLENGGVPNITTGSKDEKPFTPKFSLSYQVTPDDLVYGTISKGYRIGGASPPLPADACGADYPTQYNSDSVWSYEIGSKDRFFNRRLQISGSAYYISWSNIQQSILVPSCAIMFTANVGSAVSKGFDLQGQWQLTDAFEVEFAVGYNKANFTSDAIETVPVPPELGGGTTSLFLAGKGDSLAITPWTVTLGAQYNFKLCDRPAFVRADWEYTSHLNSPTPTQDPNALSFDPNLVNNPATNLVSLRAGMTFDKLDVALYADNLLNSHPQLDLTHQDSSTLLYEARTFRPLTIGLSVNVKY